MEFLFQLPAAFDAGLAKKVKDCKVRAKTDAPGWTFLSDPLSGK
jgi:hypothetical protein